jgi:hypothetical protein
MKVRSIEVRINGDSTRILFTEPRETGPEFDLFQAMDAGVAAIRAAVVAFSTPEGAGRARKGVGR